jgi:hypothetical protein
MKMDVIDQIKYIARGHTVTEHYFQQVLSDTIEEIEKLRKRVADLEYQEPIQTH